MSAPISVLFELLAGYFLVITLVAGFPVSAALIRNCKGERDREEAACLEDAAKYDILVGEKDVNVTSQKTAVSADDFRNVTILGESEPFSWCQKMGKQLHPMECLVLSLLCSPALAVYRSISLGSIWECCILLSVLIISWMATSFTFPSKSNPSVQTNMDLYLASSQDKNASIDTSRPINRHPAGSAAGAQPYLLEVAENYPSSIENSYGIIKNKSQYSSNGSNDDYFNTANSMTDFFEKVPAKDFLKIYPLPINQRPIGMHELGVPKQYDEKKVLDCIDEKTEQGLTRTVSDAPIMVAKKIDIQNDLRGTKRYLEDEDEDIFKIFDFEGDVKRNCRPSIPDGITDDCFGGSIDGISNIPNFEEEYEANKYVERGNLSILGHCVCHSDDFQKKVTANAQETVHTLKLTGTTITPTLSTANSWRDHFLTAITTNSLPGDRGASVAHRRARSTSRLAQEKECTKLIDSANAPIFGVNTQGLVNVWNQCATQLVGYSTEEVYVKC